MDPQFDSYVGYHGEDGLGSEEKKCRRVVVRWYSS
jgi:hypothetical protein